MGGKNSRERRSERIESITKETTGSNGMKISKNIIIFGETGVGKSSVINMLVGSKVAEVSSRADGCTFEYSLYPYQDYVFYDTVGLNEGKAGTVNNKRSTNMLIKLLKSLEEGINLIILVMKMGRITETLHNNYKLFAEVMTKNEVPVLLVVTNCEAKVNMNQWWIDNKKIFTDKYKMQITDCVCVCSADGEGMDPKMIENFKTKFENSRPLLMDLIDKNVLEHGWRHEDFVNWGLLLIKTFLHIIQEEEGPVEYWPEMKKWLKTVFKLSDEEAIQRSNDIFFDKEQESTDED